MPKTSEGIVACASNCGREASLDFIDEAHVCGIFKRPINAFCGYDTPGNCGGLAFEGQGAGGYCRVCERNISKSRKLSKQNQEFIFNGHFIDH